MTNKPKWIYSLVDFLVENITVLLTVGFASYVIYRQEISKIALSTDELLTAILGVLALLATSEIIERYRKLNNIEKSVGRSLSLLENKLMDRPSALSFFQKTPSLDTYIQGANRIDLCGVTLTSTLNKQFGNLRMRLQRGAQIRILLSAPDSLALKMSAERSVSPDDIDYYRVRLDAAFREIKYLRKRLDEFKSIDEHSAEVAGSLQVRLLSYAPSFGIVGIDTFQEKGVVFVEIYPHKFGHALPPMFSLRPERDGIWYTYFVDEFDAMWKAAEVWNGNTA